MSRELVGTGKRVWNTGLSARLGSLDGGDVARGEALRVQARQEVWQISRLVQAHAPQDMAGPPLDVPGRHKE